MNFNNNLLHKKSNCFEIMKCSYKTQQLFRKAPSRVNLISNSFEIKLCSHTRKVSIYEVCPKNIEPEPTPERKAKSDGSNQYIPIKIPSSEHYKSSSNDFSISSNSPCIQLSENLIQCKISLGTKL